MPLFTHCCILAGGNLLRGPYYSTNNFDTNLKILAKKGKIHGRRVVATPSRGPQSPKLLRGPGFLSCPLFLMVIKIMKMIIENAVFVLL